MGDDEGSAKHVERPTSLKPTQLTATDYKVFKVRSQSYSRLRQKGASEPPFYDFVTCDVFATPSKFLRIANKVKLPWPKDTEPKARSDGIPELFMINFMIPGYEPPNPIWGKAIDDGKGYSVVLYFRLSEYCSQLLNDESKAPPAIKLFQKFIQSAKSGDELKGRLKAIPFAVNVAELNLSAALRQVLSSYNAKPFLTGPKYHSFVSGENWLECDVDIHRYCYAARKAASGLLKSLPEMIVDLGIVVEGQADEELPEQLLGCCRLIKIDPNQAQSYEDIYSSSS
eukprot:TRINITY_DN3846_c0_g1_i3.p1 TRINITY_DN3846_c0_g1~~TRINITY_DN3846_c0_g1_i3.p1  ORF type:complete len:309 (+),score=45.83 TRINITY_DN3846_c0_g1_i3:77-928(+)